MKVISPVLVGLCLAAACSLAAVAQDQSMGAAPVPKVLQVSREFTKPGKGGAAHDRSESAFVQAMTRAKSPTHYIAFNALTGKNRAVFMTGFDSFAAWEKDNDSVAKNATLAADLDRAYAADGELLEDVDTAVFTYDEDLSYRASGDLSHVRYLETSTFHVKPGHGKEFSELVKLYIDLNKKAGTNATWATFELQYGGNAGTYLMLSGDKSLANIDAGFGDEKKIDAILTDEDKTKLRTLRADSLESEVDQLLAINPKQSYVGEEWIKSNPDFWKPKAAAVAAAKPAADKTAKK